jgi:hypothetical protein
MKRSSPYPFLLLNKNLYKLPVFLLCICFNLNKSPAQITYTWNQTGIADWTIAANWTPARITPAANDILLFNNAAVTTLINMPAEIIGQLSVYNNTAVSIQAATANSQLTIAGLATGDDLQIATGASLNFNGVNAVSVFIGPGATAAVEGTMDISVAPHRIDAADANAVQFNSPAVFTQDAGCTGNIFTANGVPGAVVFNAGTIFIQKAGANPFGLTQPASKVVFKNKSLFKVQQILFLSFSGRTYADLEIDFPGFNQSVTGVNPLTVDDLTITQGALSLNLTGGINIRGNISVAAGQALNFNPAAGANVSFNGNILQTVTSAGTLTFNNNEAINFNNPQGIHLNSDITFNNLVNFVSGIVTVPEPVVCTLSAAATVAGASNNSFINGRLKKIGNTAFTFPVGDSSAVFIGYVPVAISSTTGAATDYFIAGYERSPASIFPIANVGIEHVSNIDYWVLGRVGTTAPVNVTFYWTAASSNNGSPNYINNLQELIISYCDAVNWISFSGLGQTTGNTTAGSITWTTLTNSFGLFSLASTTINNPLPVSLDQLNGIKQNSTNYINWKLSCNNNARITMVLERSADGRNFTALTTIITDALRCQQPFDHTDKDPLPGMNYYRLKMIDTNDKITYSTIITLLNNATGFDMVDLYPRSVAGNIILKITAAQRTKINIVITDVSGRQLQKITYSLIAGTNQFTIDLSHLAAGTYQVTGYTVDGASKTIRFVKQ